MASPSPKPEHVYTPAIPQKRALDDEHTPTVSSPLNPDFTSSSKTSRTQDKSGSNRATREKKESLKKRESKGGSAAVDLRRTPERSVGGKLISPTTESHQSSLAPLRYKLPSPKVTDFDAPGGPQMTFHHTKKPVEGTQIDFYEATEQ